MSIQLNDFQSRRLLANFNQAVRLGFSSVRPVAAIVSASAVQFLDKGANPERHVLAPFLAALYTAHPNDPEKVMALFAVGKSPVRICNVGISSFNTSAWPGDVRLIELAPDSVDLQTVIDTLKPALDMDRIPSRAQRQYGKDFNKQFRPALVVEGKYRLGDRLMPTLVCCPPSAA